MYFYIFFSEHYQLIIKLIIHFLSGNVDKDHYLVKVNIKLNSN